MGKIFCAGCPGGEGSWPIIVAAKADVECAQRQDVEGVRLPESPGSKAC